VKTFSSGYQQHLDGESTTLAFALRIERKDGQVFGFTSATASVTIDGEDYDATQGLDVSALVATSGLAVDNIELRTGDDGSLFTRADVLGGRWQNADFLIFRYNWAQDPVTDTEPLMAGVIGDVRLMRGEVVAEFRGLQQYLQQPLGSVSTRTCRARFADFPEPVPGNLCRLNASDYSVAGEVTDVISRGQFETDLSEADDYFGEGVLTWTTGSNAGLSSKIKAHEQSDGKIVLLTPMPTNVEVGDAFTALAGCRKRLADCRDKWNNVLNFQGEPHRPLIDELTRNPKVQA